MLLALSMKDRDGTYEATKLIYHGKEDIEHFRPDNASTRRQNSGLEGGVSLIHDKVEVTGISLQSQTTRPVHLSKVKYVRSFMVKRLSVESDQRNAFAQKSVFSICLPRTL